MIAFIIKSTLCLILLLGIYYLFLEREKMHQFNRFFLLGALVLGLSIPFISFELNVVTHPDNKVLVLAESFETSSEAITNLSTSSSEIVEEVIFSPQKTNASITEKIETPNKQTAEVSKTEKLPAEMTTQNIQKERESSSGFSLIPVIIIVYAVVVYVLLLRMVFGLFKFYNTRKESSLTVYGSATLALVSETIVPHTFLNTIYINKSQYESGELSDQILDHEFTHARQKHSLDVLLIELLKIVFWFNPVFYFYKKAIQINHEFLADESVIKKTQDSFSYQQLLINSIFPSSQTSLSSSLNYSLTKKRFKVMVKKYTRSKVITKKVLLFPLVLSVIFVFCTKAPSDDMVYTIDGEKYIAFKWDRSLSNNLVLNKVEEIENTLNPGLRNYYDKDGNLFSGMLIFYDAEDPDKIISRSEIENGRLLNRVQHTNQIKFSITRSHYSGDTVSIAMFSPDNDLYGINILKYNSEISTILIQAPDSSGAVSEMYFFGNSLGSTNKEPVLFTTFGESNTIVNQEIYTKNKKIPVTEKHIETATNNAKIRYEKSINEYKRLLSKEDFKQAKYAYLVLKNERSKWLSLRKELYQNYKKQIQPPIPPLPQPLSDWLSEANTFKLRLQYSKLTKEFDEKEATYLETKTDSDLVKYLNIYWRRVKLYRELKEIDPSVKAPRPVVPVKTTQYERIEDQIVEKPISSLP